MKEFKSLLQFQKHFNTEDKCRQFLEQQRWGNTPACPFCGSINVCRFATGRLFKCREKVCRKKFSVTVGTIYESSKLPLTTWFVATYLLAVHSKGISSLQLANILGITQKSAWHLNHRIREMLTEKDPVQLSGIVEVDETYVGGSDFNRHKNKKKGPDSKAMVLGAVERGGKVKTRVIQKTTIENVQGVIREIIEPDSTMVTDEHHAYKKLKDTYNHETVNHKKKEYVRGNVHTNSIENYWSILKRQIDGIHHFVSPAHLQRYCNESAFRYNRRGITQDERFAEAVANCDGSLKYKVLINKL